MDQELTELRRRADADPGCAETARQYERALQRSGNHDALVKRYTFEFLCAYEFSDLNDEGRWAVRRCEKCKEDVYFVDDEQDLATRVAAGQCIAIEVEELGPLIDGLIRDPQVDARQQQARPCVVTGRSPRQMAKGKIAPRTLPRATPSEALQATIQEVREGRG
jgi:hypothetical protein